MPRPQPRSVEKLSLSCRPLAALAGLAAGLLTGCTSPPTSPFENRLQTDLRRAMVDAARRELREADRYPESRATSRGNGEANLGIPPEQLEEVKRMAGLSSYAGMPLPVQDTLLGTAGHTRKVSLERLIKSAVERNIAIQYARLGPAISSAQVTAAEAAFDWTFFSNLSFQNLNDPGSTQSQTLQNSIGIRRTTIAGGRLTIQNEFSYVENKPLGVTTNNPPNTPAAITIQYDQPLLRNFGSDVQLAEVRVLRNAERNAVQTLRRDLMRIITDTEKAYWELVQAQQDVLILQRLLDRGQRVRDQLIQRAPLDANQAQIADAISRVENRARDLSSAQTQMELLSDNLKALVNDPDFPLGSSVLLVPADFMVDQPIAYNLAESIRSALRYRPEIQSAILAIDDASIRQVVARNARLPDLSMRLQTRLGGSDDHLDEAYGDIISTDFVNYVFGLSFEMPIGNRRAEAEYRRRILERIQTVLAYRNTVQTAVSEVLSALRQVVLFYKQIDQSNTAVLATAEALRVLTVEKEIGPGYTIERLNVEFQQQERLAEAERQQVQNLTRYNSALADLFQAMGTTLERNNIQFVVPTTEDALDGAPGVRGWLHEPALDVQQR
jgi:outer membrane protein TolC